MFAQKKTSSDIRYLDVLVPRSLVTSGRNLLNAPVTSEGLCSLRMFLGDGSIRGFDKLVIAQKNVLAYCFQGL